jgi:anti-sigma regulatory factor (Ser/Thr protein kinase)
VTAGLHLVLPAEPGSAGRSRHAVADWLGRICCLLSLCEPGEDLVYAVSEAVANAVDHAYDDPATGTVTVVGHVHPADRAVPGVAGAPGAGGCRGLLGVRLVVSDHGRWREPAADPGARGRGLRLIEAFVDAVDVARTAAGTVVTLRRDLNCLDGRPA